jgi:hemerythrin
MNRLAAPGERSVPFFEWRAEWTLEVGFMDDDHRMLADMLNGLARRFGRVGASNVDMSVGRDRGQSALLEALGELGKHTREHFQREEDVMRTLRYPDLVSHKSEHDLLLAEYTVMVREIRESGQADLGIDALESLKQWLMGHVLEFDKQLAEFLQNPADKPDEDAP